jgi:hypothetical protein
METIKTSDQEIIGQRVNKLHHKLKEIGVIAQAEDLVIRSSEEFLLVQEFRKVKLAERVKKAQSFICNPANANPKN